MSIETTALVRQFVYNGAKLLDPGAALTVDQVRDFYTAVYPDLANAEIEGPTTNAGVQAYTFRRAVGTKGHDAESSAGPAPEKFETWGVLELFGHQRIAGRLSEQTIGGCHFIRVDVPELLGGTSSWERPLPAYTRFFTQGAIYGMTPTTEAAARSAANEIRARPPFVLDMPAPERPLLGSNGTSGDQDDDY